MRLKQYITESYHMSYKVIFKDNSEESDGETFRDKKDAVKTLNAYKTHMADNIKEYYYWDEEGNTVSLVSNGKENKKKITIKQLTNPYAIYRIPNKKNQNYKV